MIIPTIILAFLILTKKSTIEKHFSKEALNRLNIKNNHLNIRQRTVILFISIILMSLALARPVMDKKEQEFKQETISFVVALDVSKSMLADDLKPNRLAFAKQKLLQIIENSKQNAIGVILFSNSSYILSPLTQDFISLTTLVENLDLDRKFDEGSSLLSALKTAKKLLRYSNSKNIILLSDGTNKNSFEDEIEFAKDNKLKIYTVATATNKQSPIRLKDNSYLTDNKNNIITVALNKNIKELSLKTDGAYIEYSFDISDISAILDEIQSSSKKENLKNKKYKTYVELFYYPLALSLVLMLIAFSSLPKLKRVAPVLLLAFISFDAKASLLDFQTIQNANESYEKKDFKKASSEFSKLTQTVEGRYNHANSLYKEKKYKKALSEYKNVVTSNKELQFKKLHNTGNTYTKLNDLQNAIKMYEKALTIKEDEETKKNLEIVKKALKKQKKRDGNKQKKQEDKKSKENKEDKKSKDSKDKKNKEEKKSKQKKEDQKDQKESKKEKEQKEAQNQKSEKKSSKDKKESKAVKNTISDLEEKKWLKNLNNQKMKILLKKDETNSEKTEVSKF